MKMPALFALALLPFFAAAQTVDSAAIRQVDSLIKFPVPSPGRNFDQSLEVNAAAEKLP
ncbi:MAG: hypothetical protein IPM82_32680 [Saprospiraceae bacterium]|nr:hypothetical protein [Saprospiraceae bacterium]